MRRTASLASLWGAFCLCLAPATLHAQYHGATDGVVVPASSAVLQDDAIAAEINPALLGYLPGFSLAYVHAEVDRRGEWLGRGDAVHIAMPLFFHLSAGLSLQSIRPYARAFRPLGESANRGMAALSLAFSPSSAFSLGLTTRGLTSTQPAVDGLGALDLGMSFRPSTVLGFSLVGRDLFVSREGLGTAGLNLGSSLELGVQLRPLGVDDLIVDAGLAVGTGAQVAGRAGLGVRIPAFGYLSGMAEVERLGSAQEALRLVAELTMSYGSQSLSLGGMTGDGFDGDRGDWYAVARFEGVQRPGIPVGGFVLNVELAGMSPRRMLAVSLLLERARHDPRVAGVLLRPRESGMGTAYAQELRLQIQALRAAGKPVVCHLDNASGAEFYACAAADERLMDPAGSIRFMGGAARVLHFGGTLDKLGVRADFIRIGPYKSAPEQYTERTMTGPARQQLNGILDDVQMRILSDVAGDLEVPQGRVAALMDSGPQLAVEAQQAGMVAGVVDEVRLPEVGVGKLGRRPTVEQLAPRKTGYMGTPSRIGVVIVDGAIVDGESVDVPILGTHMSGGRTIVKAIDGLAADPTVRAIVLRVDSPGGSVLASDQIWRAVFRARERKPVLASMGAVAASGGYYVASAANEIWADPSTVTGSIGIFYGKVDVSPLAEKLGVGVEMFKRGKRAGAESMWRGFTPDERAALAERLRHYYRMFLARIHAGREMPVDEIDRLGRGRVYTGDAAKAVGLVDRLGGFASVLRAARAKAGLGIDAPVVLVPDAPSGLLQYLMGNAVSDDVPDVVEPLPEGLRTLSNAFTVLQTLDGTQPMALMPFDLEL